MNPTWGAGKQAPVPNQHQMLQGKIQGDQAGVAKTNTKRRSAYKPIVPAVDQASKVLYCLAKRPNAGMKLTDICKQVDISTSKGYTVLNTLKANGFVEKDPGTKRYTLGFGLLFLARNVLANLDLREIAAPHMETLARDTRGTAIFGIVRWPYVYVAARHDGSRALGIPVTVDVNVGHRFHITHGAHGKAIAAFLPTGDLEQLLDEDRLHFHGRRENLDWDRLKAEITTCRQCGFAQDAGEMHPEINAVSAPIFDSDDSIVGCLILAGTFPAEEIPQFGRKTAESSAIISRELGYGG